MSHPGIITLWPPPWDTVTLGGKLLCVPYIVLLVPLVLFFSLLAAVAATVTAFLPKSPRLTTSEVADEIEAFLEGGASPWAWDDFISVPINVPYLDEIRTRCARLPEEFPPETPGWYCGAEGVTVMRNMVHELRARAILEAKRDSAEDR